MTAFSDLLNNRRSIRDFENKAVPVEIVTELIKNSCLAPSASNKQPWKFIIVNNKDLIKRISDESKKVLLAEIENSSDSPSRNYETVLRNPEFNIFYNAPCLVYIIGSKTSQNLWVDCTLAACYFMFCASERGLGTCWIGWGRHIKDPELLNLVGLPEDHKIIAPLIVGYPKHIPSAPKRLEPQILKIVT